MDPPASIWLRSGKKEGNLFKGSRDELIKELKAWVERRKLKNQAHAKIGEELLKNQDPLLALPHHSGSIRRLETQASES